MQDVVDYALMRHGELADAIKKREAEIAKLLEEKESLEQFVCTHKELSERAASARGQDRRADPMERLDAEKRADASSPKLAEVRTAKSA